MSEVESITIKLHVATFQLAEFGELPSDGDTVATLRSRLGVLQGLADDLEAAQAAVVVPLN